LMRIIFLVTFYLEPKTKYRQERIETRNRRRTEQQQLFIWSTFEIKFHVLSKFVVHFVDVVFLHPMLNDIN
jgi:hypothetical protein